MGTPPGGRERVRRVGHKIPKSGPKRRRRRRPHGNAVDAVDGNFAGDPDWVRFWLFRRGCEVRVDGDGLLVRPKAAVDEALAEAIRAHKPELIRLLSGATHAPAGTPCCARGLGGLEVRGTGRRGELLVRCVGCGRERTVRAGSPEHMGLRAGLRKAAAPEPRRRDSDPGPLARAFLKLRSELGDLAGYEADLARAVLDAAGRGRPWPFDGLDPAEAEAILNWSLKQAETLPGPPDPAPRSPRGRA